MKQNSWEWGSVNSEELSWWWWWCYCWVNSYYWSSWRRGPASSAGGQSRTQSPRMFRSPASGTHSPPRPRSSATRWAAPLQQTLVTVRSTWVWSLCLRCRISYTSPATRTVWGTPTPCKYPSLSWRQQWVISAILNLKEVVVTEDCVL